MVRGNKYEYRRKPLVDNNNRIRYEFGLTKLVSPNLCLIVRYGQNVYIVNQYLTQRKVYQK